MQLKPVYGDRLTVVDIPQGHTGKAGVWPKANVQVWQSVVSWVYYNVYINVVLCPLHTWEILCYNFEKSKRWLTLLS